MLARVEGEGGMHIEIEDGAVESVQLNIFEPPRFYEAFLRGRKYTEPPDITARICGICPVAYQTASCEAIEDGLRRRDPRAHPAMRRLLYCGEWIESHALHIYLLHAPDFLGYDGRDRDGRGPPGRRRAGAAPQEGRQRPDDLVGGRAIHPVNVEGRRLLPAADARRARASGLRSSRASRTRSTTVALVVDLRLPGDGAGRTSTSSLRSPDGYAIERGERRHVLGR